MRPHPYVGWPKSIGIWAHNVAFKSCILTIFGLFSEKKHSEWSVCSGHCEPKTPSIWVNQHMGGVAFTTTFMWYTPFFDPHWTLQLDFSESAKLIISGPSKLVWYCSNSVEPHEILQSCHDSISNLIASTPDEGGEGDTHNTWVWRWQALTGCWSILLYDTWWLAS